MNFSIKRNFSRDICTLLFVVFIMIGAYFHVQRFYLLLLFAVWIVYFYEVETLNICGLLKLKLRLISQISEMRKILTNQVIELTSLGSGRFSSGEGCLAFQKRVDVRNKIVGCYDGAYSEIENAIDDFNKLLLFDLTHCRVDLLLNDEVPASAGIPDGTLQNLKNLLEYLDMPENKEKAATKKVKCIVDDLVKRLNIRL
jgi:hypothetical protein